jgi:hypothetical protein
MGKLRRSPEFRCSPRPHSRQMGGRQGSFDRGSLSTGFGDAAVSAGTEQPKSLLRQAPMLHAQRMAVRDPRANVDILRVALSYEPR